MKKNINILFGVMIALIINSTIYGQGTQLIKGRVVDELGLPLPGATIILTNQQDKGAVSDVNGGFSVLGLTDGDYELQVSYIGYETVLQKVNTTAAKEAVVIVEMNPGVLLGEEVLILGDRLKGQAKALNQQKTNANITNIVAADQIGRFPDANVGDAMKRIAGITMQNDQGEARDIIIRGMAPQLNSVMLNGERLPSAEGDNRRIQMDLIPSDMVQTIEVNKAVTPDMDADAIGGAVNLVTRSASAGMRVSGTLASGLNFLSQKPIWTGSVILGDRLMDDRLGVIFSASYNNHNFGSDNVEAEWVDKGGLAIVDEFDIRKYLVQRIRRSTSLNLDYQINNANTVYFSAMYNWRDDWETRYRFTAEGMEDAFDDFEEDPVGNEGAWTDLGEGRYQTLAGINSQTKGGANTSRIKNRRLEDQRVRNISLKGDHLVRNWLKVNWSGTYARASEERPNERYMTYSGSDIAVLQDISNPRKPLITPIVENSWENLELDELTEENQFTFEEDLNGRLDMQLPLGDNGILKFGGRYRNKFKKRANDFFEYSPLDDSGLATLALVANSDQSDENYLNGSQYQVGYFVDNDFLGSLDLQNENLFEKEDKLDEYLPGNYTAREKVYAGYVMTDYQVTQKLSAIVGFRFEHTNIEYQGFSLDVDNEEFESTEGKDDYTNFLPGLHLKYDLAENTILRAAWTNTLSRPNYFDLVPFAEFSPDDQELVFGNPNLKPTMAMNLDFMAENYFKSIGVVSAGVFYKDIEDFIYNYSEEGVDVPGFGTNLETSKPENGGTAEVYGVELGIQRQLDFLPGFLSGFGIYLNYTHTNSETTGIQGREEETLPLVGTAENMFNASLSYETEKLVLRLSLNHATDYIDELGSDTFNDRYYDKQTFLDFNGSFAFSPKWRAFAEVNNLTNQPLRYYQGVPERLMQEEFYDLRVNVGLKFDLFGKK